jgi:hypothetical protein
LKNLWMEDIILCHKREAPLYLLGWMTKKHVWKLSYEWAWILYGTMNITHLQYDPLCDELQRCEK